MFYNLWHIVPDSYGNMYTHSNPASKPLCFSDNEASIAVIRTTLICSGLYKAEELCIIPSEDRNEWIAPYRWHLDKCMELAKSRDYDKDFYQIRNRAGAALREVGALVKDWNILKWNLEIIEQLLLGKNLPHDYNDKRDNITSTLQAFVEFMRETKKNN